MAAFFALIAGLAIGLILGICFIGFMVGYSVAFRNYVKDMCTRLDLDLDI